VAKVEIIVIGTEILLGSTQDTNSSYLCRVVRATQNRVRHIAVVADDNEEIAIEVRASIERAADLVFTCGGLGPTDNDLTLAAVARAVGVSVVESEAAKVLVERRYAELASKGFVSKAGLTGERLKMARLPEGADAIANPVGAAPAVVLMSAGSRIVCLPGVPTELTAIVEGPLQPLLGEMLGRGSYAERGLSADCGDESVLAPIVSRVSVANPNVYVKTRPTGFGPDLKFRIRLSASSIDRNAARAHIERAAGELVSALAEAGIRAVLEAE
jgi:molybdenum cofactor synthesis domain-containing protein